MSRLVDQAVLARGDRISTDIRGAGNRGGSGALIGPCMDGDFLGNARRSAPVTAIYPGLVSPRTPLPARGSVLTASVATWFGRVVSRAAISGHRPDDYGRKRLGLVNDEVTTGGLSPDVMGCVV